MNYDEISIDAHNKKDRSLPSDLMNQIYEVTENV